MHAGCLHTSFLQTLSITTSTRSALKSHDGTPSTLRAGWAHDWVIVSAVVWGSCRCTQSDWECGALAPACPTSTGRGGFSFSNCHLRVKLVPTMEMNHQHQAQTLTMAPLSWGEPRWEQVHGQHQSASGILCCFFSPWKTKKKFVKIPTPWAGLIFLSWQNAVVKVFSSFLCHFFRPHERVNVSTPTASLPAAVLNMSGQIIRSFIGKLDRADLFFFIGRV